MYVCEIYDYKTSRKYNFNKHMLSKKHQKQEELSKKVAKNDNQKVAKKCDKKIKKSINEKCYDNQSQKQYDDKLIKKTEILSTKKVAEKSEKVAEKSEKVAKKYSCECGKMYKYRQTLYVHRKKCDFEKKRMRWRKKWKRKWKKK